MLDAKMYRCRQHANDLIKMHGADYMQSKAGETPLQTVYTMSKLAKSFREWVEGRKPRHNNLVMERPPLSNYKSVMAEGTKHWFGILRSRPPARQLIGSFETA